MIFNWRNRSSLKATQLYLAAGFKNIIYDVKHIQLSTANIESPDVVFS